MVSGQLGHLGEGDHAAAAPVDGGGPEHGLRVPRPEVNPPQRVYQLTHGNNGKDKTDANSC